MKQCSKCNQSHNKDGKFCSRSCANSRVWTEQDKQKKSLSAKNSKRVLSANRVNRYSRTVQATNARKELSTKKIPKYNFNCEQCLESFSSLKKNRKFCSSQCFRIYNKKRCNTISERNRLRDIGRKGGFGFKGYTSNGIYFQSKLEHDCFELLDRMGIIFEAHKHIPNSTKISDVYLSNYDLWIELDGIDRERHKDWLGKNYLSWKKKLKHYRSQSLNFKVVKSFKEFQNLVSEFVG